MKLIKIRVFISSSSQIETNISSLFSFIAWEANFIYSILICERSIETKIGRESFLIWSGFLMNSKRVGSSLRQFISFLIVKNWVNNEIWLALSVFIDLIIGEKKWGNRQRKMNQTKWLLLSAMIDHWKRKEIFFFFGTKTLGEKTDRRQDETVSFQPIRFAH